MYEMEWNVGIYRIFLVKLVVGWSNNRYKIILTVWLNFCSNLAIRSSYNCWKHFVAVGSSQHWFSTIGSQIWPLDVFTNTWVKSGPLDPQKSKFGRQIKILKAAKKSLINRRFFGLPLRLLRACLHSRLFSDLSVKRRYFADISAILLIFSSINNPWRLSFRCRPISDISLKYQQYFLIFQSLLEYTSHQKFSNTNI